MPDFLEDFIETKETSISEDKKDIPKSYEKEDHKLIPDEVEDPKCNKIEIFSVYLIIIILVALLIFLINIRGFIIPAVGKDWFFQTFVISISFILVTILAVAYENHIHTSDLTLRNFLIFIFIVQLIILVITISQFFTHGNIESPAILSATLAILVLIWFILSYNSKVRFLLLIYIVLLVAFAILLLNTERIIETQ